MAEAPPTMTELAQAAAKFQDVAPNLADRWRAAIDRAKRVEDVETYQWCEAQILVAGNKGKSSVIIQRHLTPWVVEQLEKQGIKVYANAGGQARIELPEKK